MTDTSTDVKAIQDRNAASRARVIDATMSLGVTVDPVLIQAAMMELAAIWREDAAAFTAAKRRGHQSVSKELIQAAGRLAGFAVGLTSRPVVAAPTGPTAADEASIPMTDDGSIDRGTQAERCAEGLHPEVSLSTRDNVTKCTACGTVLHGAEHLRIGDKVTVAGIEFTKIRDNPFFPVLTEETPMEPMPGTPHGIALAASVPPPGLPVDDPMWAFFTSGGAPVPAPAVEQPQFLAEQQAVAAINPFVSPAPPTANRRPVAPIHFASLPSLADALRAAKPRGHVSHSYVESYESCGLKALLSDASRAELIGPTRPGWSLIGGNAFHSAVELIEYDVLEGRTVPYGDGEAEDLWDLQFNYHVKETMLALTGTPYADPNTWYVANSGKEGFDWWRVEGVKMVGLYLKRHDAAWREVNKLLMIKDTTPCLEFPYTMAVRSLDGTTSTTAEGFIDQAWLNTATYQVSVVDLKSGSRRPDSTFQLGEYAHALLMAMGLPAAPSDRPILGQYYLARQGIWTDAIDAVATHPLEELQYRYDATMRGTNAGIFTPHPSNFCASCSTRDYCPIGSKR